MLFALPVMLAVVSGEALEAWVQRPRRRRAAGMPLEVRSFWVQLTADVLPHWMPTWQWQREH
eukprot:6267952-Ditylum_brightwellii.AAC.1